MPLRQAINDRRSALMSGARYVAAVGVCALVTVVASAVVSYLDLPNVMLLFLLGVVFVAWRLGKGPALLAAFLSVALFDYFFVPPRLTFVVDESQYVVTFAVLFTVALIIGQLTASLHHERDAARRREGWLRALYETARELSAALRVGEIIEIGGRSVEASFGSRVVVLLADEAGTVQGPEPPFTIDPAAAQFAFDYDVPMGGDTAGSLLYLPLRAPMRTRGVLVFVNGAGGPLHPEERRQLDSFVALIATALERVHYIEVAQNALVRIESERLRSSVLAALSHDLRTPLTALVGTAESLLRCRPALTGQQEELAGSIRDQAFRMSSLVENLLDMARFQSGEVRLNLRWQPLEEVIGSALRAREPLLAGREVRISLAHDLPPLLLDATLMERVFVNLLENAAKYTPAGSPIGIEAHLEGNEAVVSVRDRGPGVAPGSEQAVFEKFVRGDRESSTPGMGLGLAICRAIIEAHRGRIWAERVTDGAGFFFSLPIGTPPRLGDLQDGPEEGVAGP